MDNFLFIGEQDTHGKPAGFVRLVSQFGHVSEGNFTPNCHKNGFCVTYVGYLPEIEIGWYLDDREEGNFMIIDGKTMKIKFSGFYSNGQWMSEMREHYKYKKFEVQNVFKGPLPVQEKDDSD